MKRIVVLILALIVTASCSRDDKPRPVEGEKIKTVKLGESFAMKIGDKVRIQDTLYYNSGKTDSIVPVYLNYILSLDSIRDGRCFEPAFCDPPTYVKGSFTLNMGVKQELFDLILQVHVSECKRDKRCYTYKNVFDSICVKCSAPHFNMPTYGIDPITGEFYDHYTHYISVLGNMGFCITLDSLFPTRVELEIPTWQPGTPIENYYSDYVFYLRIIP